MSNFLVNRGLLEESNPVQDVCNAETQQYLNIRRSAGVERFVEGATTLGEFSAGVVGVFHSARRFW